MGHSKQYGCERNLSLSFRSWPRAATSKDYARAQKKLKMEEMVKKIPGCFDFISESFIPYLVRSKRGFRLPRIGVAIGDWFQLVMREGIFVVTIPTNQKSFFDCICAVLIHHIVDCSRLEVFFPIAQWGCPALARQTKEQRKTME